MSITNDLEKSMMAAIEKDMDKQMESLFTMVPKQDSNLSIDELMKTMENPKQAWLRDSKACLVDDIKENRGKLILNPEYEGTELLNGDILDGKEYRAITDQSLAGATNKDGSQVVGYWVDPLPPLDLTMPLVVEPKLDDMAMRARFYSPPKLIYPPINFGVEVVDLGPVPFKLPKMTARAKKRNLVQVWRNWRGNQIARGEKPFSFKEYARQCKAGRAWLERKKS